MIIIYMVEVSVGFSLLVRIAIKGDVRLTVTALTLHFYNFCTFTSFRMQHLFYCKTMWNTIMVKF